MTLNHLAFICKDSASWALKKKKRVSEGYKAQSKKILELIDFQIKNNIPITTYHVLPAQAEEPDEYNLMIDELTTFLIALSNYSAIHENRVKISVLGKWYNLPPRLIEAIKKVIDDTKEYDGFFLNFCINYDGQEEIVDACKMVARRVKLGKIDADAVTKDTIKDDLYSSYFLPPDAMIVTGKKQNTSGFLLWDSVNAEIIFTGKSFIDLKTITLAKMLKLRKK